MSFAGARPSCGRRLGPLPRNTAAIPRATSMYARSAAPRHADQSAGQSGGVRSVPRTFAERPQGRSTCTFAVRATRQERVDLQPSRSSNAPGTVDPQVRRSPTAPRRRSPADVTFEERPRRRSTALPGDGAGAALALRVRLRSLRRSRDAEGAPRGVLIIASPDTSRSPSALGDTSQTRQCKHSRC